MKNKVEKTLTRVLKGKKILFLENGDILDDSVGNLSNWLKRNGINYTLLLRLESQKYKSILELIDEYEVIVFETTWTTEISKKLKQYILSKKEDKKIIIECYVDKPSFNRKPDMIHTMYVLDSYDLDVDSWELNRLKKNKTYWV